MRLNYILNAAGEPEPCDDILLWGAWFEHDERRVVRRSTFLAGEPAVEVTVSTVFLGLDHGWDPDEPPVLWETMVFGPEGEFQRRYQSREAAIRGHNQIVAGLGGATYEDFDPDNHDVI